jgi:hypothetical protein
MLRPGEWFRRTSNPIRVPGPSGGQWTLPFNCKLRVGTDAERRPYSWDPEQVQEFRSFLQTDDIASVDAATYGKRFSEII